MHKSGNLILCKKEKIKQYNKQHGKNGVLVNGFFLAIADFYSVCNEKQKGEITKAENMIVRRGKKVLYCSGEKIRHCYWGEKRDAKADNKAGYHKNKKQLHRSRKSANANYGCVTDYRQKGNER